MTILFFGDSLMDNGNLGAILEPFGIEPFPSSLGYNDNKASDGKVLAETISDRLGIDSNSLLVRFSLETTPNVFTDNINYAISGAKTSFNDESDVVFGVATDLQSQIALFKEDFALNSITQFNDDDDDDDDGFSDDGIDAIISAGTNNVAELLVDDFNWANIFLTPENDDNKALRNSIVNEIVDDIKQAVDSLNGAVDDIAILGLSSLGDSSIVIQIATQIDSFLDKIIPGDYEMETRDFLTGIAKKVNRELRSEFDNPEDDVEDVLVVNGSKILKKGLRKWRKDLQSMGLEPIENVSYQDYILGNSDLPSGLVNEQFAWTDLSHPSSYLNEFLADQVVSRISPVFDDFGVS